MLGVRDIEEWIRAIYRPDNAVLFVVGRMEPEAVKSLVEQHFGDWEVRESRLELVGAPEIPEPMERSIVVLDKERVSQSDVTLGCQVLPQSMENAQTHTVLGSLLSELSWIALREQSGVTYGAGSGVQGTPVSSPIDVQFFGSERCRWTCSGNLHWPSSEGERR